MRDFSQLVVGEEVGLDLAPSHTFGLKIATVKRVLKSFIELEDGRKFRKDGNEMKSANVSYPRAMLRPVEYVIGTKAKVERNRATTNAIKELVDLAEGRKNGLGQVYLTEVQKAELVALAMNLPTNA